MDASGPSDELVSLHLPSGHAITYACYGVQGGRPILFCHGFPGSRLQAHYLTVSALESGAEILAPDRPGIGGSTGYWFDAVAEWAKDAESFVDALGIGEFAVIGVSGGGPYALAVAARLAERVRGVVLVASPCELGRDVLARMRLFEATVLRIGRAAPRLVRFAIRRNFGGKSRGRLGMLQSRLDVVDQEVIASPNVSASLAANRAEAVAGGTGALERESVLYTRPWGFDLADVTCRVDAYYGVRDQLTPPFMGERLVAQLANAELHLVPGHGHFTLLPTITREILEVLGEPVV